MGREPGEAIQGLDIEEALPQDLANAFLARAVRITVPKGQMLLAQGTDADDVYLILSGRVNVSVFSSNGREVSLREMGRGRLLGEMAALGGTSRSANCVVIEDAVLARISATAFRTFLQEVPGAGYWMTIQLAARVRNLTEKSSELATLPVAARLISELLRISTTGTRTGDRCSIAAIPTHTELAARIGTHREAVTRELRALAREGLVVQSGRHLELVSVQALKDLLNKLSG